MGFPLSLAQDQYEALIALARKGATEADAARSLEAFLISLESAAGITRHSLWVQWQELHQPLPPGTDFPAVWPPSLRYRIDLISRPVARADVNEVLAAKANQPIMVLVTRDPAGLIGWMTPDLFFIN